MAVWATLGVGVARNDDEGFKRGKSLINNKEKHKTSQT